MWRLKSFSDTLVGKELYSFRARWLCWCRVFGHIKKRLRFKGATMAIVYLTLALFCVAVDDYLR